MSTLAAEYSWPTLRDELRAYLRINGVADEDQLAHWTRAAIEIGDQWLGNSFVDADGVDVAKPESVRLGIYEYVRGARDHHARNPAVTGAKTDKLEEQYGIGRNTHDAGLMAALPYWSAYRLDPLGTGAARGLT